MIAILGKILRAASPSQIAAMAKRAGVKAGKSVAETRANLVNYYSAASPAARKALLITGAATVTAAGVGGALINNSFDEKKETSPLTEQQKQALLTQEVAEADALLRADANANGVPDTIEMSLEEESRKRRIMMVGDGVEGSTWNMDDAVYYTAFEKQQYAENMVSELMRATGLSLDAVILLQKVVFHVEEMQFGLMKQRQSANRRSF